MPRIISCERLTPRHVSITVEARELVSIARPGQVVLTRFDDSDIWLPHPIGDFDREEGTLTLVTRIGAPESKEAEGEDSVDEIRPPRDDDAGSDESPTDAEPYEPTSLQLSGPFGRSLLHDKPKHKALFVAEGLGVAAIHLRVRQLKEIGCYTIVVISFASKEDIFWRDRIDESADELLVVTEDGSFGIKGPAKQTLRGVCEHNTEIEQALVTGSLKFIKSCSDVALACEIPTVASLAAIIEPGDEGDVQDRLRSATLARYNWDTESDLNAHQVDFDELGQKLGVQTIR